MMAHVRLRASQALVVQSPLDMHFWLIAHFVEQLPPQSVSVSVPSRRWSLHASATHSSVCPSHAMLTQSELATHLALSAQAGQVPPPQSTSVSAPSFT